MGSGLFGPPLFGAPLMYGAGHGGGLQQAINIQQQWKWHLDQYAALLGLPLEQVECKSVFKTQKARGLEAGWVLSNNSGYGYKVAPYMGVMPHVAPAMLEKVSFPKFARPCPLTPRHGFVESRDVKNIHELEALFKETREHDPDGELIIMDRLSGAYSAVMTANGVAWGLSNDGVTSGKGESRVIPTPAGKFDQMFLPYLGVKPADYDTNGVYCELVEDKGAVCVVQMRLGPKQSDSRIKRVTLALTANIRQVIQPANDDLIAWDNLLKKEENLLRKAITLVWLPGQTMASHFAVQGIANGYNVSTEEKCPVDPVNGGILKPDTTALAPLEEADFTRLGELFKAEKTVRFWDFPRDVLLGIGVLHALPYWDNAPHLLALRARGAMIAARYGLAACLGESRHHLRMTERPAKVPWAKIMGAEEVEGGDFRPSRSYVFVRSFSMPWEAGAELALAAAEDMRIGKQPPVMEYLAKGGKLGDYGASFMGQKWEWAALRVHDLHVAVDRFCNDPNKDNWGVVLGHYNEIINAAHNGGYLLNKWCSPNLIDNAATAPAIVFGFRNVMNLVWDDQRKDEPRVAWMPMTQKPIEPGHFVETELGVLVPSLVWAALEKDGVLDAEEQCKCNICMAPKWPVVGEMAMSMGLPCYVPDDKVGSMPKFPLGDDKYSKSIEAITAGIDEKTDPKEDDEDTECHNCGHNLDDGECQNDECYCSPNFVPTCWACDKALEDDECPDEECEASPKWKAAQKAKKEAANKAIVDAKTKAVKDEGQQDGDEVPKAE